MKIVGGIDVGDAEAPAIWEDKDEGVDRCIRGALRASEGMTAAIVIGFYGDRNELYIASNLESTETAIGFIERAKLQLLSFADQPPETMEDGA